MRAEVSLHKECGGFYQVGGERQYVSHERMMPTERVLESVLVPLFIIPNVTSPNWNDDHTHFEAKDPRLTGDKLPLRNCSVQHMPVATHRQKNKLFDAVEMPTVPSDVFQAVLFGAARYVPHFAVDLSNKKVKIIELTDSYRHEVHQKGWMRMERRSEWRVGLYLAEYAINNGLQAIVESGEVDEFLNADLGSADRTRASFKVVRKAVDIVIAPFEPTYEIARKDGGIRRPEATAARFLTRYFDRHQPDYIPTITENLLAMA